jgi:hypothetical protein
MSRLTKVSLFLSVVHICLVWKLEAGKEVILSQFSLSAFDLLFCFVYWAGSEKLGDGKYCIP